MRRNKKEGAAHRARLRAEVLPYLRIGFMVPTATLLSGLLGVSPSEAARHMRRVLEEDGFTVVCRGTEKTWRLFITGAPAVVTWARSPSGISYQHYEARL